jgi:glycerol kinase
MAATALELATTVVSRARRPVIGLGITNQRASTVVWDRQTGEPIAPGLGWQDLRTVLDCITLKHEHGLHFAPNQSVTKLAWLLANTAGAGERDLCFGTVDTWLTWTLSGGTVHATDHTNAGVTGLTTHDAAGWNDRVLEVLGIPPSVLPELVPSSAEIGPATALPGAPVLAARAGDQQCSLVGQGCVRPGLTKITFGTGGMLDTCTGTSAPATAARTAHGTFPIVAWSTDAGLMWGSEAIMLSAGSNVEWLREDLGILDSPAASHDLAASVASSDGVMYVPALLGLGTPNWDYGARGTLLGLTRGVTSAHLARAVLEGVAHRGVDLVEAAEADLGAPIDTIRVDGGMSSNPTFVQALADLGRRRIEVSPIVEATTVGAAVLAGVAVGLWGSVDEAAELWRPARVVEPGDDRSAERHRWSDAVRRSAGWIPELSELDF